MGRKWRLFDMIVAVQFIGSPKIHNLGEDDLLKIEISAITKCELPWDDTLIVMTYKNGRTMKTHIRNCIWWCDDK
jgi:hypothetical protein